MRRQQESAPERQRPAVPPAGAAVARDLRQPGKAPPARRWRHFDHDADVGLIGQAPTMAGAFEAIATALTAVVVDPEAVRPLKTVTIRCEAADPELLLYDWLNRLIYEMAVHGMLFCVFAVELHGRVLSGRAWGEPVSLHRHGPAVEVKGATWTALSLRRDRNGWTATCVVDV